MIDLQDRPIADRIEGVPIPQESRNTIGHDDALQVLFDSFHSGRMHHAWLLNGPRGIGKATAAIQFSKYLLGNPDRDAGAGSFDASRIDEAVHGQVVQGAHPGLLHLTRPWDEKTKRFKTKLSIEEVRRTSAFYGMTAGAGGWRITIVDAANDMNASAANALLKILEEPPKRSLFLVLSHSAGSLLSTIRSRCQRLNLNPLSEEQVVAVLKQLAIQASDADKLNAARLSEGSVRRAIQLIEGTILKEFSLFEGLMAQPAQGRPADWLVVHKIADTLSRRGQEDSYHMFLELVTAWIGQQVRQNSTEAISQLAGWADVWDKAIQSSAQADAFNLDKKQVILSLFGNLFERKMQA